MTARAIARLLPPGATTSGQVRYDGAEVGSLRGSALRDYRGEVAMIFQDPRAHINPVRSIGDFMTEALRTNRNVARADARARAVRALGDVGIEDGERRLKQYPHELSGGLLAAGDDRGGAPDRAAAGARRRADDRAGCDHPGRGDGDPRRAAARARPGAVVHHPRPGPGRRGVRSHVRDVRGADRRVPALSGPGRAAAPPVHRGAVGGPPGDRGCGPPAGGDPRSPGVGVRGPRGMRVRAAL